MDVALQAFSLYPERSKKLYGYKKQLLPSLAGAVFVYQPFHLSRLPVKLTNIIVNQVFS
jgi:hypothetical protein